MVSLGGIDGSLQLTTFGYFQAEMDQAGALHVGAHLDIKEIHVQTDICILH